MSGDDEVEAYRLWYYLFVLGRHIERRGNTWSTFVTT